MARTKINNDSRMFQFEQIKNNLLEIVRNFADTIGVRLIALETSQ